MDVDPRRYWVGFNLVKGIGAVRLQRLLDHFGSAQAAWHAEASALKEAGLGPKLARKLIGLRKQVDLARIWQELEDRGIQVLTWLDTGYPDRLLEINQPPPVLYLQGDLVPDDQWAVAIVGTRRVTSYGRQVAEELAAVLVQSGVTVVSGLARGVDSMAHRSALYSGGRTIAVLGSGVDRVYPPENRRLAEEITRSGAVVSDYAPGTPPEAVNFPPRNRIISGLAQVVVVIEGGARSGALITAAFAAEQGREVFAVPGNIFSPRSVGTNRLIRSGAHPMTDANDVLEALNLERLANLRQARRLLPDNEQEREVLNILGFEARHVDEISRELPWNVNEVLSLLAMMELKGLVQKVSGMRYVSNRQTETG